MPEASTTKFNKLITLLKELFQLDQPDLDFGIYRIMHAKSGEVTQFLEHDLLPQVQAAFNDYRSADKSELEKELAKVIAGVEAAGMDPAQSPKVTDLRARLASEAVDIGALENEVYDHLYSFFRRYYSEGDFLSKRVYKAGVYAIPYEGEEVALHWANKDQYYIKTSESFRDYSFRLQPDSSASPKRVHFRLVEATEGEHGNVKATKGKERRFKLAAEAPVTIQNGELFLRFTYQPDEENQKTLNSETELAVLAYTAPELREWVDLLGRPIANDGDPRRTVLAKQLNRYTSRNTFDYFIHKDLGGFLRRELDFYVKNEVMHLDDVESDAAPRVEQYLSKIKVIRRIAGKVIQFLEQLERFQKKLWRKKKFVVETAWCVRLDCIPEAFYPEIARCDRQREEWVALYSIDEITGDLAAPGYSAPLSVAFLKAHPTLVVDTRNFEPAIASRILESIAGLDEQTDCLLIQSENFQALSLLQARYRDRVDCIYIDPPYNTGGDGFAYKDNYQHSSWASALNDRLALGRELLKPTSGCLFASIDDGEQALLRSVMDGVFGPGNFSANIIWQKKYAPANDAKWFSDDHDFVLAYARDKANWRPAKLPRSAQQDDAYNNPDNDPRGPWRADNYKSNKSADERPNLFYGITNPTTGQEVWPQRNRVWAYGPDQHARNVSENRVWWGRDGTNAVPAYKRFLSEVGDLVPRTLWKHEEVGHNQDGIRQLRDLLPETEFTSPKPTGLIERVVRIGNGSTTLDFFAGSGTTGHAVVDLNRADGAGRKVVLVEMGDYFDTVLVPRMKKVTFAPEWRDGKPLRMAQGDEVARAPRVLKVVRLESYEDALNNLQVRRNETQRALLESADAQGPDGLREQFLLRYLLEVETRGSPSVLSVGRFGDPTGYTLSIRGPGSDELRSTPVDLIETFNQLIGLVVDHVNAPRAFSAEFQLNKEGRLVVHGRLKLVNEGPYWFRTVSGCLPSGLRVLVIWRKLTGDTAKDNAVLETWFKDKQAYSVRDTEYDLIYVNGDNTLENLRVDAENWKVKLIEEDFHRLMFEGTES